MLIQSKHELWPVNLQEFELNLHCCQKREFLSSPLSRFSTKTVRGKVNICRCWCTMWTPSTVPLGPSCLSVIYWIFWFYINWACSTSLYICMFLLSFLMAWYTSMFFFPQTWHPLCFLDHLHRLHSNLCQYSHLSPSSVELLLSSQWFHKLCKSLNLQTTCVFPKKKNSAKVEWIMLWCCD